MLNVNKRTEVYNKVYRLENNKIHNYTYALYMLYMLNFFIFNIIII